MFCVGFGCIMVSHDTERGYNMADIFEITSFLNEVRNASEIDVVNTKKNRHTRLLLGITVMDQEDMVRNLSLEDYQSGPEKDRDSSKSGSIWVFITQCYGASFYIKIKDVFVKDGDSVVRCLSCHIENIVV